ncbi:class C sortase [Corynebacterium diphtheriae]|nr:class C sortase [Corynebacterium diphtheriae]CAB0534169.1 class C sortase [Corynebacterium diphtheriae]
MVIPAIKTDLPIYHGTQEDTLQRGIGHLFGSDLPVGGEGTHSILTGHTGLPNATLFDNLKDLKEDDTFFVQVAGHKLKYQVDQIKVVLPDQVEALRSEEGKDFITLVTCTPYGINTHRLLVRGHQVPITENEKVMLEETQSVVWQWWMYALTATFIFGVVLLVWWLTRQTQRAKK